MQDFDVRHVHEILQCVAEDARRTRKAVLASGRDVGRRGGGEACPLGFRESLSRGTQDVQRI